MEAHQKNFTKKMLGVITSTVEAFEHMSKLLKEQKYLESMHMFEVILEGYNSIQGASRTSKGFLDDKIENLLQQIKKNLHLVIHGYETNNYGQLWQIVNFSLLPAYRNLMTIYKNKALAESESKRLVIGVYHPTGNLTENLHEDRTVSLALEAEKRNVDLVFFNNQGVNFDQSTVVGEVYIDGEWIKQEFPLPDVIQNYSFSRASQQTDIEKKLRSIIPFTSFAFGNKYEVPKSLRGSTFFKYFIPFKGIISFNDVKRFFLQHNRAVIKPFSGRQGNEIIFVTKSEQFFHVSEHRKKERLTYSDFESYITSLIENKSGKYMIQPFIETKTKDGSAFDIRAHLQKNGQGKWEMTLLYPRISRQGTILTNMRQGGRTLDIRQFLVDQFGTQATQYEKELRDISFGITERLDKQHGLAIDEVGIDITVDVNGRFWIYEINQLPGARIDEYKRAINSIAYSIYLAEKQIFWENKYQRM